MKKPAGPKPNIEQTFQIINRELGLGNLKRAESIAAHLRSCYPRRADVNDMLGTVLAEASEYHVAYHYHKLAVDSDRFNTNYLENVAGDLLKMGRVVEADAAFRRVFEINPRATKAQLALASFYFGIGLGDRALQYFDLALEQAPANLKPLVRLQRMECLISMGRGAECEQEFEHGIDAGAYHDDFVALYAGLDKWNVTSDAYRLVLEELQRTDLNREMRSRLLMRKARMEENSGYYDQSYETLIVAKRVDSVAYDVPAFRARCAQRISALSGDVLQECWRRVGHASKAHVFVVGMPRSGTTLTEQIIASHSMAGGAGELETMSYLTALLLGQRSYADFSKAVDDLGPSGVAALAEQYEAVTQFLAPGKTRVVDKMPQNFLRLGEISVLFPNAKFVHCTRNVADTFISAFQNDMKSAHSYSFDRDVYGDYYSVYLELMRHWYGAMPGKIFTLEYEKLVSEPRRMIGSLLEFLELPFEEACLNPQDRGGMVRTFSRLQVRSAINPKSVGRWRKYESHLAPLARRFEEEKPFPPTS